MATQPRTQSAQRPAQQRPQTTTPVQRPPLDIAAASNAIEKAVADCGVLACANLPQIQQALRIAQGIAALKAALTDQFMYEVIMPLRGSALGFLTDLDNGVKEDRARRYDVAVVRECCVEGMMRGFRVVGNEFNIIGGRFYGAKAGFERQVIEFPGLTDLVMEPGVPAMRDGGAVVPFIASWKLDGRPHRIECMPSTGPGVLDSRIPVKVNAGMGADAVLGKAYRKMYFRIWQRLHGSAFGLVDGEVTDADAINTTGTPAPAAAPGAGKVDPLAAKAAEHAAKKAAGSTPPPANDAPANDAAAPDDDAPPALTLTMVIDALVDADESWSKLTSATATAIVESWTTDEQRRAYDWAIAFVQTPENEGPPEQPEFTFIAPEPGSDG